MERAFGHLFPLADDGPFFGQVEQAGGVVTEDGLVLVLFALLLSFLIGISAIVVDVGL